MRMKETKYLLKPCPKCGKMEARIGKSLGIYVLCCTNCCFSTDSIFLGLAVRKWNKDWARKIDIKRRTDNEK